MSAHRSESNKPSKAAQHAESAAFHARLSMAACVAACGALASNILEEFSHRWAILVVAVCGLSIVVILFMSAMHREPEPEHKEIADVPVDEEEKDANR